MTGRNGGRLQSNDLGNWQYALQSADCEPAIPRGLRRRIGGEAGMIPAKDAFKLHMRPGSVGSSRWSGGGIVSNVSYKLRPAPHSPPTSWDLRIRVHGDDCTLAQSGGAMSGGGIWVNCLLGNGHDATWKGMLAPPGSRDCNAKGRNGRPRANDNKTFLLRFHHLMIQQAPRDLPQKLECRAQLLSFDRLGCPVLAHSCPFLSRPPLVRPESIPATEYLGETRAQTMETGHLGNLLPLLLLISRKKNLV